MSPIHSDVLIIGAGSAGCVVANRLSADPARTVTVLEAGGRVTDPDMRRPELWPFIHGRDYDWAYQTEAEPGLAGRRLDWARGRGLGGSSLVHAMAHMRGSRSDFAAWEAATGDARWSWDGLLPAFIRMESFSGGASAVHGADGPLPVLLPGNDLLSPVTQQYLSAWEGLGVSRIPDHNHGEMIGATPNSLTIRDGERVTVADAYLEPVLDRPNLHLVTGAQTHRLQITRGSVTGVEVSVNGESRVYTAETVVLAAGSIGDALLLMRSGVGDPEVLAAAGVPLQLPVPEVGKNLHDHLLGAGNVYQSRMPVPPSRLQLSESMTYLSAAGLEVRDGAADVVVGCSIAPSISDALRTRGADAQPGAVYTLLFGVTNPTSRGELRITGPHISDAPEINARYLSTAHDRDMFRAALEYARTVGQSPELAQWRDAELLPLATDLVSTAHVDAFIANAAITHHHPVGTLRMGADAAAPVRPDLSFRGIDNLSVVDAAVIPSITAGPVHAAVLAIAESFSASFAEPHRAH